MGPQLYSSPSQNDTSSDATMPGPCACVAQTVLRGPTWPRFAGRRLLDGHNHRIGPDQRLDVALAAADVGHPATAVRPRVVEPPACLDQHVQAHQQPESVLAPL